MTHRWVNRFEDLSSKFRLLQPRTAPSAGGSAKRHKTTSIKAIALRFSFERVDRSIVHPLDEQITLLVNWMKAGAIDTLEVKTSTFGKCPLTKPLRGQSPDSDAHGNLPLSKVWIVDAKRPWRYFMVFWKSWIVPLWVITVFPALLIREDGHHPDGLDSDINHYYVWLRVSLCASLH